MRKFTERDKEILKAIDQQDTDKMFAVGYLLKKYFRENEMALFLCPSLMQTFLLCKDVEKYNKGLSQIVELVSLIETMEKLGYIYCISPNIESPFLLYNPIEPLVGETTGGTRFQVSIGNLEVKGDSVVLYDKLWQNRLLEGRCIDKIMSNKVNYYFSCFIYPSDSLKELIANNFEDIEIQSYKRQIKEAQFSRNMAIAALFVSLFFPLFMTFFNNKYAKTEIKETQYELLLSRIDLFIDKVKSIDEKIIESCKNHDDLIIKGDSLKPLNNDSDFIIKNQYSLKNNRK